MASSDRAVGIDLGTTFSVVSYLDNEGKPQTVQNAEGDLTTPSVVYFGGVETVVGKEAVKVAQYEPNSIAQFAKRDVGKSQLNKAINGQKMPPEAIQAVILKKLRDDAVLKVGEFSKVVITVPAFFNEPRRKATMDAGKLAGLDVVDIINEPTAAAIAYGVQEGFIATTGETGRRETVMVYDLGGGTFDVTLMEIDGVHYKTLATGGDVHLGGIDWDQCVVNHVAEEFEKKYGVDPRKDAEARQTLLQEAEDAKRALSARATATIHFACDGNRLKIDLSREQFESLTAALLQRTIFTANRVLKDGGRKWSDLTRLLLVGGSTRMPMIQEALEKESGMKPDRSVSPDESVAHGAALYCGFLIGGASSSVPGMEITNVSSHDLGVLGFERETGLPRRGIIIPRNTSLPAKGASRFTTKQDDQKNVKVQVVEGGDASGKNATQIGKCVVTDLPESLPAGTPVIVKFYYATNGRLKVAATVGKTKHDATMVVERASGLSDKMITQWKQWLDDGGLIQGEAQPEPKPETAPEPAPKPTKPAPVEPELASAVPNQPNLPQPVDAPSDSVLDQLDDAAMAEMEDLDFEEESFSEEEVFEALPVEDAVEDIPMAEAVPQEASPVPDNAAPPQSAPPQSSAPSGGPVPDGIDVPEPKKGGPSFDFDTDDKPSDDGPSDWSFLDG